RRSPLLPALAAGRRWPNNRDMSPPPPIVSESTTAEPGRRLALLSANIQAGARTDSYRDYLTRPWAHVLPHATKQLNLDHLARLLSEFDLVGLQESDPGSLRSGFLNQTHYLAEAAGFPFWSHQPNRKVGRIASSANALLSRVEPDEVR